ncbi:MAG: signal peptide peptidase SppA [Pseudomonadota bacterium]
MTATADMILEKRKARRRLTFWRVLAIVAVVIAIIAILPSFSGGMAGPHIARVSINGVIFHDVDREKLINDLVDDDQVKAVVVAIDSPGGTLVGSEALYDGLRKVADKKPVVAVMSELAASGGYMTAIAADHIVARRNTLTGSIGVIMEAPNFAGLLEMVGVDVTRIKSAPLKAEPSPTTRPSPAAIAATQDLIDDGFEWFKGLVAERRDLSGNALDRVTDGRVFSGNLALELGLIDALGDEQTALDWLQEEREIDADLKVLDRKWTKEAKQWPWSMLEDVSVAFSQPERIIRVSPRLYAVWNAPIGAYGR